MKKILFISLVTFLPISAMAFPGADMSPAAAPFNGLLQQSFEREELNNYEIFNKKRLTAEEQKVHEEELKQEAKNLQKFKKKTRIDLEHGGYTNDVENGSSIDTDIAPMQFENRNGKIFIKAD